MLKMELWSQVSEFLFNCNLGPSYKARAKKYGAGNTCHYFVSVALPVKIKKFRDFTIANEIKKFQEGRAPLTPN